MTLYDVSKIGCKIADGGDRKVYRYDTDSVIKFSSLSLLVGKKLQEKYRYDFSICKKYFGDFIVDTIDVSTPTKKEYIEIQPFIPGEMLHKKHAQNEYVRSQLEEIVQITKQMEKDHHPLPDLVGNVGMISPCLSNLIIDPSGNVRIIDAILLEGKSVRPWGLIIEIFTPLILARQNYLLRTFLK